MGHITLIPKVPTPEGIGDYRPITLLNCMLKLITKLLADRLQKIVLKIVHKNQYGFLKGRTIQDCLAWAFEFLFQCETSRQEIILLKLDFAKAFDTIDHSAMLKIMKQMGFSEKWLGWIQTIFSTGKSAVLLNGVPRRQFFCKRGVRQGDPLSPLIFVLAADLLQSAINKTFRSGLLRAPFSPDFGVDFPVIQYADDTLIIMPADETQILLMKNILEQYANSTGLKINFYKSSLVPINISTDSASDMAGILGCKTASMPFTYLGLPLGTTKPSVQELMPLVDRIERRVSATFMLMS
jgi:retron-type reverse transcriptase